MKLYGEISKTEELDDGTIKVWGFASSESVDSDGETITADAMKAALPDYMKFGAVREMHQAKAAGTAIEAEVQEDGRTYFGAHIVDAEAVKKVKAKVYKGFSIGGKATGRDELNKTIVNALKLVEVSLVDRPANPDAVFTMYKADDIDKPVAAVVAPAVAAIDSLADLLNKGAITPERLMQLATADTALIVKADKTKLRKGMYGVSNFAQILASINYLMQDTQWEAEIEGDGSDMAAKIKVWLSTGGDLLRAMVDEEVTEMVGAADPDDVTDLMIEMSANPGELRKRLKKGGAKFSKDSKDKLAKAHQAVKDASDHLASTGYDADDNDGNDDGGNGKGSDDSTGKATAIGDLTKVSADLDIVKADLQKVVAERDGLQKRVTELEAMPAPGKALLKAVSKSQDIGETIVDNEAQPQVVVKNSAGEINEVASLIKMQHQSGGVIHRV